jgi:hypothetical protein
MCIACEMDFWLIADELAPEEPSSDFVCDVPQPEAAKPEAPASENRD